MALFHKPPAKKPDPAASARNAASQRGTTARELTVHAGTKGAAHAVPEPQGTTTAAGASIIDWSPAYAAIEVSATNPGLCAVLENAALLYAGGQGAPARLLLAEGVATDQDTKQSPLAWLALFDLLQRACDRPAFDQLALQFVVQFERSAPAWEEPVVALSDAQRKTPPGGYVALAGRLSASSSTQLQGVRRVVEQRMANARLDLSAVISFDDAGARMLADLLAQARKARLALSIERPEKLRMALEPMLRKGREGGQGAWLLTLELMQWQHEQSAFDDRAVDYAIAFEMSPPSWEPPPRTDVAETPAAQASTAGNADQETLVWSGTLAGPSVPQIRQLTDHAHRRHLVTVDMTGVERVDFVCAGALLNAINRIESQRKTVQIMGASPIVRALLLLIGISPRHFVKKNT
jgi:ABC-type transporter Mla MlaB component